MTQPLASDFPIDPVTTSGTALADILNRFADSVGTNNSGATAPPDTMPGMFWLDTSSGTNGVLKMRNAANTGWIAIVNSDAVLSVPVTLAQGGTGATTAAGAKVNLGLDQVNNTSDANKPVSTAQAAANNLRVLKSGDTITGDLTLRGNLYMAADSGFGLVDPGPSRHLKFTTDGWRLEYFKSDGSLSYFSNLSQPLLRVDGAGNVSIKGGGATKPGGGPWSDVSDERIKDGVADYMTGLDAILQLRPRTYSYKTETNRDPSIRYIGLIAQEAEGPMPEMVRSGPGSAGDLEFDDMRTLDTTALVFALVNAVKAMHEQVQVLRDQYNN